MRGVGNNKINKDLILKKIDQISIFAKYLNIDKSIIINCIKTGDLIISPLREDRNPTCGFKYDNRGKLKLKDFAGYFWGDCFDVVAIILSYIKNRKVDISNKQDFNIVLQHIAFTFKDIIYGEATDPTLTGVINDAINKIKKDKANIEIVTRQWTNKDINYWKKYGITIKDLNLEFIYPVEQYYINRSINPYPKYFYDEKDPCYGYFLGVDSYNRKSIKLYFPLRGKNCNKFITNSNHLEGIYTLNEYNYDIIIVTKSTKDRVALKCMINRINKINKLNKKIGVINIPHETYIPKEHDLEWLRSKLSINGKLICLMDNDRAGIIHTIKLVDDYNMFYLLIPKILQCKDYADLVSKFGIKTTLQYTIDTINNIDKIIHKQYERKRNKHKKDKECDFDAPF